MTLRVLGAAAVLTGAMLVRARADADERLPPWFDALGIPVGETARSILPRKGDVYIHDSPALGSPRRGLSLPFVNLPIYSAIDGSGCRARWIEIGPYAWVCGEQMEFSQADPKTEEVHKLDDNGLFYRYFFAPNGGAILYTRPTVDSGTARELDPGWGIATTRDTHHANWAQTPGGHWVSLNEVSPARPSAFHGESVSGGLALGWVIASPARVYGGKPRRPRSTLSRQSHFDVREVEKVGTQRWVRISDDDEWLRAQDAAIPEIMSPPKELNSPRERWIDISLASQTLVAYEGDKPVYATLVSTGRGTPGNVTPTGTFRVWVKIRSSTMDNIEREGVSRHYSMDEVPYVQFFSKDIALHAAYWHRDFGKKRSHGCVNLSPLDARVLFAFTFPSLPPAWQAVYPTPRDPATVVVVR